MLGLELQSLKQTEQRENMDVLASLFLGQLPDNVEIIWQINSKYGHPHTMEYIVGFDKALWQHTDNP